MAGLDTGSAARSHVVALILACLSSACASSLEPQDAPSASAIRTDEGEVVTPLTDQELIALFHNVYVGTEGVGHGSEGFFQGGNYAVLSPGEISGRFWVMNGQLCVKTLPMHNPRCRRVGSTASGIVFELHEADGVTSLTRYRITKTGAAGIE